MTENQPTTPAKRPGSGLLQTGLLLVFLGTIIAIYLAVAGGTISGLAILIIIVGIVLAIVGFARRLLAAVEGRK